MWNCRAKVNLDTEWIIIPLYIKPPPSDPKGIGHWILLVRHRKQVTIANIIENNKYEHHFYLMDTYNNKDTANDVKISIQRTLLYYHDDVIHITWNCVPTTPQNELECGIRMALHIALFLQNYEKTTKAGWTRIFSTLDRKGLNVSSRE